MAPRKECAEGMSQHPFPAPRAGGLLDSFPHPSCPKGRQDEPRRGAQPCCQACPHCSGVGQHVAPRITLILLWSSTEKKISQAAAFPLRERALQPCMEPPSLSRAPICSPSCPPQPFPRIAPVALRLLGLAEGAAMTNLETLYHHPAGLSRALPSQAELGREMVVAKLVS